MSTLTAAETETLARLAYEAWRETHVLGAAIDETNAARPDPWPCLSALQQEAWRAGARAIVRALK